MLGAARLALGDADAALQAFDGALAIEDDLAEAHVGRGDALREVGRVADAPPARFGLSVVDLMSGLGLAYALLAARNNFV